MSDDEAPPHNFTASNRRNKEVTERSLHEADCRVSRSVDVQEGTKKCFQKAHSQPSSQTFPGLFDGNCTIHPGGNLVILDIDVEEAELPQLVRDLPPTLVVRSPHGGQHRYYILDSNTGISSSNTAWGSIRYEGWYVLCPGSVIDHSLCRDDKKGCPGEGIGDYAIDQFEQIATLTDNHLDNLREACSPASEPKEGRSGEYGGNKITLPDKETAIEAERYICTGFTRQHTDLAGSDKMDLLRGGTGSFDLQRNDGRLFPSFIEWMAYLLVVVIILAMLTRGFE
ncbi:MAG: bifunctional DNA primase/polymerase [Halobacteriales archaeon]|nr:bifunctional DNA primase/polymerase [Halobacteriales archaeon]